LSKAYQFSKDPSEPNPFAETAPAVPAAGDNPYAAPQLASLVEMPGAFEQTAPHRGTTVLLLGLIGMLLALLMLPLAWFCFPISILTLALSIPAWFMGRQDRHAMWSGAMDPGGRGATTAGWLMGIVGIALVAAALAVSARQLFYGEFE
jgi:hypothetical protein